MINALAHVKYYSKGNKEQPINTLGIYLDELKDGEKGTYGKDPSKKSLLVGILQV
ncbi:MAG: hypothetical protein E6538_08595 [Paeniclostridium sordellii]|nr:hypothetical protein [Paeniclostridium sordellii]